MTSHFAQSITLVGCKAKIQDLDDHLPPLTPSGFMDDQEWVWQLPCGLIIQQSVWKATGDVRDSEVGILQGAHVTAHVLDELAVGLGYLSPESVRAWTLHVKFRADNGEILAAEPRMFNPPPWTGSVPPW